MLPVCFKIGNIEYLDDLHIYSNVTGTLMLWKTCKELGILPLCYPNPFNSSTTINSVATTRAIANSPLEKHLVVQEFPAIFDGNINSMEGEQFHIYLTDDVKPFCVNTPRSIPYAFRDKLKTELYFLRSQNIYLLFKHALCSKVKGFRSYGLLVYRLCLPPDTPIIFDHIISPLSLKSLTGVPPLL